LEETKAPNGQNDGVIILPKNILPVGLSLLQVISLQKKQRLLVVFGFTESPGFKHLDF
jgi:hypothetical protein